ncbi:MAG: hypothetical protein IJN53_05270 [Oscillospiraceae bacterium]|nr:hypothetical protein [Oscillospiraceae bacterium]
MYADECGLLVFVAFSTSGSLSKNTFSTDWAEGKHPLCLTFFMEKANKILTFLSFVIELTTICKSNAETNYSSCLKRAGDGGSPAVSAI